MQFSFLQDTPYLYKIKTAFSREPLPAIRVGGIEKKENNMENQKIKIIEAKEFADKVKPLSSEQRKEINDIFANKHIQNAKCGYDMIGQESRFQGCDWQVYEGDLIIENDFLCNVPLVITGNLIVKGNYIDDAVGGVIVYGNIEVEKNIISEYPMLVVGNTSATGLIYLHYNDYSCEFLGDIQCDILFIPERDYEVFGEVKAQSFCYDDVGDETYMRTKLKEEAFEIDDEDKFLDPVALTELIYNGRSIYKK